MHLRKKHGNTQIGNDAKFRYLKRCPRCTVPARNPETGDWLYPKNKRLPQKTLKSMFPLKAIDKEWEEQWQGPTFSVHIGWDGEGADSTEIQIGDMVNCFVFHNLPKKTCGRIMLAFVLTLGVAFIVLISILKKLVVIQIQLKVCWMSYKMGFGKIS